MNKIKSKKVFKNEQGVTLIALIITIIVLLILAGVAFGVLLGQNGLIARTISARDNWDRTEFKESVQLDISDVQLEYAFNLIYIIDLNQLEQGLNQKGYTTVQNDGTTLKMEYENREIEIDQSFIVTLKGETKDTTSPTGAVQYSITVPTVNQVTVTLNTDEDILTPAGWNKVDNKTYTKAYTGNIDEQLEIKDVSGNAGTVNVKIANIRTGKTDVTSKQNFQFDIEASINTIYFDTLSDPTFEQIRDGFPALGYTVTPYGNDIIIIEKSGGLAQIDRAKQITVELGI